MNANSALMAVSVINEKQKKMQEDIDDNIRGFQLLNQYSIKQYKQLMQKTINMLTSLFNRIDQPSSGILVCELRDKFKSVNLDIPFGDVDQALAELHTLFLKDAVYFHHSKYLAHLNCPIALSSLIGELVASSLNTAVETWDQSAGGTLIEQAIIDWIIGRIGFNTNHADGVFTSGGSQSNLMGLLLARDSFCQSQLQHSVKMNGLPKQASRFKILTSEVSHFSVQKSAALLGLGYDSVETIPIDENFCIDLILLEERIKTIESQGDFPIAVVATAGTTDFGSIDRLSNISKICQRYDIWMHVDAAYGGGLLMSKRYRQAILGIEMADSVTVDFHKSFYQPVSCSAFFVKNKRHLAPVTYHAEYLNPLHQENNGIPNSVNKSLQTTRRFDALKLWMTLRIDGADSLGESFEYSIQLAQKTYWAWLNDPMIEMIHQPQLSTLVFRFLSTKTNSDEHLNSINQKIRETLARSGKTLIAGTKIKQRVYLKMTLLNPKTTENDIHWVMQAIKQIGVNSM